MVRLEIEADHEKIRLLPAWPKEWNVEFKLHAPGRTVVEGCAKGGRIHELRVTPEGRMNDIEKMEGDQI